MPSTSDLLLKPGTIIHERYRVGTIVNRGNQGQVFDVEDLENPDPSYPKVVKVVENSASSKKLKIEAEKLSQIQHPGVPRVEGISNFFEYMPEDRFILLPCLVMEKIPGTTLLDWIKTQPHPPISQSKAIAWLKQLIDILDTIHAHGYLHRDIKPENIMVTPDEQLVLIDFGIGREETESYYEKQQRGSLTRAGTVGYEAPEQMEGRSSQASDFYSVGRTFVHLLTGCHPGTLAQGKPYQISWRKKALHISDYFADIIDGLMHIDEKKRYQTIKHLPKHIQMIETLPQGRGIFWRELPFLLGLSILISLVWIGIRSTGLLRPAEFLVYDTMLSSRPLETPDPRLVIITIDEEDIRYQKQRGMIRKDSQSLSDEAFLEILNKSFADSQNSPRLISLDLVHDFEFIPNYFNEIQSLGIEEKVIYTCSSTGLGIESPPGIDIKDVAFNDVVKDVEIDGLHRRHLINMLQSEKSPCQSELALSTLTAGRYLTDVHNIYPKTSSDGSLQFGTTIFHSLIFPSGGYQNFKDNKGYTILTNYRSLKKISDIAPVYSLRDFLKSDRLLLALKDKIILIGAAQAENDEHSVPVSSEKIYGVFIHAHELSQLLSAVLDNRPLLIPLLPWQDNIFILGWSILQSLGIWICCVPRKSLKIFILYLAISSLLLWIICYYLFLSAIWATFIPPLLSGWTLTFLYYQASVVRKIVAKTSIDFQHLVRPKLKLRG